MWNCIWSGDWRFCHDHLCQSEDRTIWNIVIKLMSLLAQRVECAQKREIWGFGISRRQNQTNRQWCETSLCSPRLIHTPIKSQVCLLGHCWQCITGEMNRYCYQILFCFQVSLPTAANCRLSNLPTYLSREVKDKHASSCHVRWDGSLPTETPDGHGMRNCGENHRKERRVGQFTHDKLERRENNPAFRTPSDISSWDSLSGLSFANMMSESIKRILLNWFVQTLRTECRDFHLYIVLKRIIKQSPSLKYPLWLQRVAEWHDCLLRLYIDGTILGQPGLRIVSVVTVTPRTFVTTHYR
jgi:hypothetical protein